MSILVGRATNSRATDIDVKNDRPHYFLSRNNICMVKQRNEDGGKTHTRREETFKCELLVLLCILCVFPLGTESSGISFCFVVKVH